MVSTDPRRKDQPSQMTMPGNTGTRRRRGNKAKPSETTEDNKKEQNGGNPSSTTSTDTDEMTLWQVFTEHPLIKVGKFILIPYAIYLSYFYFQLHHPEYISKATAGIIELRPAVGVTDLRQLLIVGSPSTGTVQMHAELRNKLRLEIGHENTDTAWNWVRDGTVSWFHGIRFLTNPTRQDKSRMAKSFSAICDAEDHINMGFHPAAYREPVNRCSYRSKWDNCWRKECYLTLIKEWGCATSVDEENGCEINFATTLHQVRNPMRTLESLVVKFCIGGLQGSMADSFLIYASALFPSHNFYADSCIEATGYFLVEYQNAMIEARKRGEIAGFYRIEDVSACDVAAMAGLLDSDTTIYEPNYNKIQHLCDETNTESPARQVVEQSENKVNTDIVRLGWKDLRGGAHGSMKKDGDADLEKRIRSLYKEFGYDESQEHEEAPSMDPISAEDL